MTRTTHPIPVAILYYLIPPDTPVYADGFTDLTYRGVTIGRDFISYVSVTGDLAMVFNSWDGAQYIALFGSRQNLKTPITELGQRLGCTLSKVPQWPELYHTKAPRATAYDVEVSDLAGLHDTEINEDWSDSGNIVASANYVLSPQDIVEVFNRLPPRPTVLTRILPELNYLLYQRLRGLACIITDDDTLRRVNLRDITLFTDHSRGHIVTDFMSLPVRAYRVEKNTKDGATRRVHVAIKNQDYIFSRYRDRLEVTCTHNG